MSDSLRTHGLHNPWNSLGQNTGVGSCSLLQGIFPTQGLNPGLLHCRQILYHLSHQGSPRILEWAACPCSRGSSRPRNWTGVSCTAGGLFTNWAMREAHTPTQNKKYQKSAKNKTQQNPYTTRSLYTHRALHLISHNYLQWKRIWSCMPESNIIL